MVKLLRRSGERDLFRHITGKLINLKDIINDRLDAVKKRDRKQQQQPKGKLPEWDGQCESYLDLKAAMMDLENTPLTNVLSWILHLRMTVSPGASVFDV